MLCRCFFRELSSAGSCGAFANVRIRSVHKESKHIMICYSLMTEAHFATNCSLKASRVQMAKTGTESVCENCVGDEEMKLLICVRDIDTCNRAIVHSISLSRFRSTCIIDGVHPNFADFFFGARFIIMIDAPHDESHRGVCRTNENVAIITKVKLDSRFQFNFRHRILWIQRNDTWYLTAKALRVFHSFWSKSKHPVFSPEHMIRN